MLNCCARRTSPWQRPQVSGTCTGFTEDAAAAGGSTSCAGWQELHTGAATIPLASAWPCTLSEYCAACVPWQEPHNFGMAVRNATVPVSLSSCGLPWHTAQSGAFFPWALASACLLADQRRTSDAWHCSHFGLATPSGWG